MTAALWTCIALLAADAGLIAWLVAHRATLPLPSALVTELAPLAVVAGVLVALIAFLFNLRRSRSEDLLDAATDLLEKAHEALVLSDSTISNRRHAWLSAARLIATAENLGTRLAEESHKIIYQEKRRYWKSRLYDLIFPSPPEGLPSTFYADSPEHFNSWSGDARPPISEKSIAYLYRFIRWPEGESDPLAKEPALSDEEVERMRAFGPRGLGQLLAQARVQSQPDRAK
ncbi:MAG: hypothetical protein HZC37_26700 [Burkholderiales bacterium]|nr:hypothetical protein [Burkholderiales bacterium]